MRAIERMVLKTMRSSSLTGLEECECFDKEYEAAIEQRQCEQIFQISGCTERIHRRFRTGEVFLAGHVETQDRLAHHCLDSAGEGIHSVCVGEDVDYQAKEKSDCKHPVDRQGDRQSHQQVDEYQRHSHVEKADVVEHYHLRQHEDESQQYELKHRFAHVALVFMKFLRRIL